MIIGFAVVWMASAPRPAWGQSAWPSYPNNTAISVTSGGNVGIGTTAPKYPLHIGNGSTGINAGNGLELSWGNGSGGARDWLVYSDQNFHILDNGYNQIGGGMAAPAFTIQYTSGNVGIGTTNPQYLLSVNGPIGAKDVIVTNTGWSDYVFRPGYRLRPLSEVNAYIQANHHLPDIPSEAEVKEKGVSVGEMQSKLLAKIEELTLHMIRQDQENRELRGRIAQLEAHTAGSAGPVR